jgi:hypothetical protein
LRDNSFSIPIRSIAFWLGTRADADRLLSQWGGSFLFFKLAIAAVILGE